MPSTFSPYTLLKASKPRQGDAYVTEYALYSAANQPPAALSSPPSPTFSASPAQPTAPLPAPERTHYIADIHSRHSRASSRAKLTGAALPIQPPSCGSPHEPPA